MDFLRVILLSIFLASTMFSSSEALNFVVGGKNGWSVHPSESYSSWANRLRFQVNDTLTFEYNKETDCVAVVTKNNYEKCEAEKPIKKMDGGDSVFKFDRSGLFYFITGNKSNCDQGQKLTIVVLAVRNKSPPTPSMPAPSPAPANNSPVPSPGNNVPVPSPSYVVPAISPAPVTSGPVVSPVPENSGPAVSPAPWANAPGIVPTPSPSSPGNSPADNNWTPAPAPSNSFAPAISPAKLATAVLSVTVAAFVTFA